ncbi:MAG: DNA translocase FtsK [Clostridia bacterium]|nr:DNA translocase FtsK [Clostridia bacterium]
MASPAPTVYRVTRRRMTELDIPVNDITVPKQEPEKTETPVCEQPEEQDVEVDVQAALEDTRVDRGAVDEQIFDEVMRRTRERIEKSRRAEDMRADTPAGMKSYSPAKHSAQEMPAEHRKVEIPDTEHDFSDADMPSEILAGDVLDAVEMAALGLHEQQEKKGEVEIIGNDAAFDADEDDFDEVFGGTEEKDSARPTEAMPEEKPSAVHRDTPAQTKVREDETDTVRLAVSGEESDAFDVTKIFVNPADAELLDKLSEQYRQPLDVQRTTVSAPSQAPVKPQTPSIPPYQFPPTDILADDPGSINEDIKEELQENAVKLVETLKSFRVSTKIENISRGPTITRYELLLDPGVRVRSVVNLVDDISLSLATTGVRIEAPIPGKAAVGIEVPNKKQTTVHLRKLIEDSRFRDAKSPLTVALGEDVAGEAVYFDIGKMPHLLIAGATGAGKSVCINSIITSLLYKASPEDVKLILIDPKKVELSIYNGIPHLLVPVVSEPKKAAGSLSWAVGELERRYGLIDAVGVRDITGFNEVTKNDPDYEYMPRIVIVIDELADLMMTAPDDVEDSICRIAQKARAAGMHLIIGTQRPSVDVITGLIKANVPSRIAFRTSSQIDSRTIIDVGHAANLIGMGDMLFNPVGALKPRRVQGAYVNESDVEEVVAYIKNINAAYDNWDSEKIVNEIEREAQKCGVVSGKGKNASAGDDDDGNDEDPMLKTAVELAIDSGKISTSLIQRRLSLGYGRAAKLIDRMEQLGYVSAPDGSKPREVLITKSEYMEMRLKDEAPFDL